MTGRPSPYVGLPPAKWASKTNDLINAHPLNRNEIVDVVLQSWEAIFDSRIGARNFKIGKDIFPKPQILGFLLHELVPLEFESRHPGKWRPDTSASDKDLVYVPDAQWSVEIKTSSSAGNIFGNRSYAQRTTKGKKDKTGYYLAVNFEKCTPKAPNPGISVIRFGWLDHQDWMGQKSQTGQQARLSPQVEQGKLITLYSI